MRDIERQIPDVEHATVYRDDGEYSSQPFNAGTWLVDGDVVVAFFNHECAYATEAQLSHERINTYGRICSARSTDGGRTWELDGTIGRFPEISEQVVYDPKPAVEGVDFADSNVLLTAWAAPTNQAPGCVPWIKRSEDGGRSWGPPVRLPTFHFDSVIGRPNYAVRADGTVLLACNARLSADGKRHPVIYTSEDGGVTWTFTSYITENRTHPRIHPAPVVLNDGTVLAAARSNPTPEAAWTEIYASEDGGKTWSFRSRPNETGAPATLSVLDDGRLLCVYGYRRPPFGVRARISEDDGHTWGHEWILRDDGATWDVGYPRSVALGDGEVLVTYYINEAEPGVDIDGGVRYVAATRFEVPV